MSDTPQKDLKQAALDYSVLKEEERKDIRVAGEMRRKEMLGQQQVAVLDGTVGVVEEFHRVDAHLRAARDLFLRSEA